MKIRLAKKILFSKLYEKKHAEMKPAYWSEKEQKMVIPARKQIAQIVKATKRYVRWYNHKMWNNLGIKFIHNEDGTVSTIKRIDN